MTAVRFATARDLFEAFPSAARTVATTPTDEASPAFVQRLLRAGEARAAVAFCAYLLGRRSAIGWMCACLRQVLPGGEGEEEAMRAGSAWVAAPDDERRRQALEAGRRGDPNRPATWVGLAAGWSGGSLGAPGAGFIPIPDHLTAEAVLTGLVLATFRLPAAEQRRLLSGFAETGLRLAERVPEET